MIATEQLKLNLGSRTRSLPGFKNMDIDNHENVDYVGDVSDLSRFHDESVSEIYASHILEHFPSFRTVDVLREWNRVLVPSGILYCGVPDFARAVELYEKLGFCDWIQNYLWGDQEYKTAFHYAGFTEKWLRELLGKGRFSEVSRVESFPFKIETNDCSTNISNFDGKSVSLNMIAIK